MKVEIEKYFKVVSSLIDTFGERKDSVEKMLESIGERYFTCPASSKKEYHGSFPGGLVVHSVEQTKLMLQLQQILDPSNDSIPKESIIMCGLFHDLGKIGDKNGNAYYVVQEDEWRVNKLGEMYKPQDLKDGLTHAQRSVRLLSEFDVKLTDDEYFSILHHDGPVVEENRNKEVWNSKCKLFRLLSFTDAWTCFVEGK